jgi:hypothetical protein
MGIGFVLLILAIVGAMVAGIAVLVFGFATAYLTREAPHGRKALILVASLLPLVCFGWVPAVFACQAVINETVLHRDAGLGDTWRCPLPNGYALLMIDTTGHGFVYNPKTQWAPLASRKMQSRAFEFFRCRVDTFLGAPTAVRLSGQTMLTK